MERLLPVKFDTDYIRQKRLVRSPWGGWTPGTVVEVSMEAPSGYPEWVNARIERWNGKALFVTLIPAIADAPGRGRALFLPEPTW